MYIDREEIIHIHDNDFYDIYNFGRPFLSSLLYTLYFWSMPGIREEDFKGNNAFSRYNLYGHAPAQEILARGSWNLQLS